MTFQCFNNIRSHNIDTHATCQHAIIYTIAVTKQCGPIEQYSTLCDRGIALMEMYSYRPKQSYTVEPPIKDPLRKGQPLIKDTF